MPASTDVEALLESFAGRDPSVTALLHDGRRTSYGELVDRIHRTARALRHHGVGPGRIVTLLGGNTPEMIVAQMAANLAGAGIAQPYEGLSTDATARIVDDVDTALLVVDPPRSAVAAQVLERCAPVEVVSLGAGPGADLAAAADAESTRCDEGVEPLDGLARPGDVEQIRHTGGTTGHPKGIVYTFERHLRMLERSRAQALGGGDEFRVLVCTPLAHVGSRFAERALDAGGLVVLHDGFEAGDVLATIERERITHLWLLPPLIHQLLDHPDLDRTDLSSLRSVVYGGTPASPRRMAEAVERIGPVFTQAYAQTESGPISMLTPDEHRPGLLDTVGRVVPTTDLEVRDPDGHPVPDGERGELWVRTGMESDRYWKQPELTAWKFRDGWTRTGDIGFLDADAYLHVVDRIDDMIAVVGGHVYTSEVEDVLREHDGVHDAAVFGVADDDGVQHVHAAVVADADVSGTELAGLVEERKGAMYAPAAVQVVDRLPLTDTGKPDKKVLRRRS